jgi:DNA-binding LacI/PurR family transcriptional regulator
VPHRNGSGLRVTIDTVAEAAQVSRQTVTNALRHPQRVKPATLARVRAEIERLGYRPSLAAQTMQSQRSGAVGIELNVLGPHYHNAMMAPFLAGLSVESVQHNMHMVTFGSAGNTPTLDAYEQMRQSQVVDAFVIADTHVGDPRPDWLGGRGIPFASFGRVWDDPTFTRWVDVDGQYGTALAVDHCRGAGYQRIGYLGWPPGQSPVGDSRREGWLRACRSDDAQLDRREASAVDDLEAARFAAAPMVAEIGRGGAVVCASDVLAVGVLHAVLMAGLRPGVDLGIVGFDDSELARMHAITSVSQPMEAVSSHVLRLVRESLSGDESSTSGVLLRPDLAVRASTAGAGRMP